MKKILLLLPLLFSTPAFAQEATADRIDQLERQVLLLQTKIERGSVSASTHTSSGEVSAVGNAQTDVRISTLEDELRSLRGKLEEKDFENKRLAGEMEKFKRDSEFRIGELEKRGAPAANEPAPPAPHAEPEPITPAEPETKKLPEKKLSDKELKKKLELSVRDETHGAEEHVESPKGFETPQDHYNYAFRLLNQNQYDEAAKVFLSFTKKYPKEPLIGNAFYWLGETHYIRKDYNGAADNFRQGFEALPGGPKAGDNLLKLGMSLAALKKTEEACVVLSQVMKKFKTANTKVASKAEAEHKRAECD